MAASDADRKGRNEREADENKTLQWRDSFSPFFCCPDERKEEEKEEEEDDDDDDDDGMRAGAFQGRCDAAAGSRGAEPFRFQQFVGNPKSKWWLFLYSVIFMCREK